MSASSKSDPPNTILFVSGVFGSESGDLLFLFFFFSAEEFLLNL